MKKKRFTEQQIVGFLREAEAGMPVKELCRKHGFSDASFYAGALGTDKPARPATLEERFLALRLGAVECLNAASDIPCWNWIRFIGMGVLLQQITGHVSAFVEHFFDVDVPMSQRSSNGFHEFTENFEPRFIEENHGISCPEQESKAFVCSASVFDER